MQKWQTRRSGIPWPALKKVAKACRGSECWEGSKQTRWYWKNLQECWCSDFGNSGGKIELVAFSKTLATYSGWSKKLSSLRCGYPHYEWWPEKGWFMASSREGTIPVKYLWCDHNMRPPDSSMDCLRDFTTRSRLVGLRLCVELCLRDLTTWECIKYLRKG